MTTQTTARRSFTDDFKREAVSLLASSGRLLTQVAIELGIQPSMLRSWRGGMNGGAPRVSGAMGSETTAAPSAGQSEILRLRRDLERAQMERDILKRPSAPSRFRREEVLLHRGSSTGIPGSDPGSDDVRRAGGQSQWLLCVAGPPGKRPGCRRSRPRGRDPPDPCGQPRGLRQPRMHAALRAEGRRVGVNRVARLMRHHGIQDRHKRRVPRTTDSQHSHPIAANVLDRQFITAAPNRVWIADITYIPTGEGWLYLAVVLDMFSRRVVGWAMRETMPQELTIAALQMAITLRRPGPGLVHHSDRGSQGELN